MIRETIQNFLAQQGIPTDSGFLVAVSGGPDSIALLHALKYLNLRIWALHCNFRLRGKESDRDEQFVKRFCHTYGIALSVKQFETETYAKENGISIEMAARELRYAWFREMKTKKQMEYILVGHQADDVAETVFINLCRGTGIKGLTGIKSVNGDILRPLLTCSREDILEYMEQEKLGFRTDSSNNSLDYTRNIIRHKILPVCKEINPSFLSTLRENCQALQETEQIFRYGIRQLKAEVTEQKEEELLIHIAKTLSSPAPYTLLYELLHPLGFNKTQIRDILNSSNATPGKKFHSENHCLCKGRTHWRLFSSDCNTFTPLQIEKEGIYNLNGQNYEFRIFPKPDDFTIDKNPSAAYIDAEKIKFPLLVRSWQTGDNFCPIGMKKLKKKISDFFTDQKFSLKQKKECLLLVSEDKIAWIVSYRLDDRFKITSSTRKILHISPFPIEKK